MFPNSVRQAKQLDPEDEISLSSEGSEDEEDNCESLWRASRSSSVEWPDSCMSYHPRRVRTSGVAAGLALLTKSVGGYLKFCFPCASNAARILETFIDEGRSEASSSFCVRYAKQNGEFSATLAEGPLAA